MRALAVVSGSVGIAALVLLGGCTSSSGGGGESANGADIQGSVAAGGQRAAIGEPSPAPAAGAKTAPGGAGTVALVESQALIRTADLQVAVKPGTVGTQAGRAEDIAIGAGGSVFGDDRSSGKAASASLTLKVPPDSLDGVLDRLAGLGAEQSRNVSTQDVTQQVADVDSRVQSARDSIARLRALYDHAVKVSDVISIEGELATREADLESLEAQQRSLAAQTSMATVRLELTSATPAPAPPHKTTHRHGIAGAFVTGWHGFTAAVAWLARALATTLPFLVVVLLLAGGGLLLWRRRPTPAAPSPTPTPDAG